MESLIGKWQKATASSCADRYPTDLEFLPNGLYRGTKEPGEFSWWDVGNYQVLEPGRVAISTANDSGIVYTFSISEHVLTFTDEVNCQFQYRQA